MQQKIEKWQRDISHVREAVTRLADYRRWNRVYETTVNANQRLPAGNAILRYFRNIYADYAVMAIRRQARPHRDSVSLLGLLEDLAENSGFITREWTRKLYMQPHEGSDFQYDEDMAIMLADNAFERFADESGNRLKAQIVLDDTERVKAATREIVALSDTAIAHDDRGGPEYVVTFDQLNIAIDVIDEVTRRYVLLLTGASMLRMTPYDTTHAINVFKVPWIDPEHPPSFGEEVA